MWSLVFQLIASVVLSGYAAYLATRKTPAPTPGTLDDLGVPRASEGSELPKIFGTVNIDNPQIAWFGDLLVEPIIVRGPRRFGFIGPRSSTVTGYVYKVGLHFVACLGPVDAILRVMIDKRIAWQGLSTGGLFQINEPGLFGGDTSGGGIVGPLYVLMGKPDQTAIPYLPTAIGANQPGYRGVVSMIWAKGSIGNSPSLRPWSFRLQRINAVDPGYNGGVQWYSAKAGLALPSGHVDMNPAHILREVLLSPDTAGTGNAAEMGASWTTAADMLYAEGFGLSLVWGNTSNRDDFKKEIERHIDGRAYLDRRTGLWEIKLLRADYDIATLPLFDRSNVVSWDNIKFPEAHSLPNQVVVTWSDPDRGEKSSLTLTNPARVRMNSSRIISEKVEYPGIQRADLATRVAARDLVGRSSPLLTGTIIVSDLPTSINLGSAIMLHNERMRIYHRVVRVTEIEDGGGRDNAVRVSFIGDRFALTDAGISDVEVSLPPVFAVNPVPVRLVEELPYYGMRQISDEAGVDAVGSIGLLQVAGGSPGGLSLNALIMVNEGAGFVEQGSLITWAPVARIWSDMAARADQGKIVVAASADLAAVVPGSLAVIGGEQVRIDAVVAGAVWTSGDYWAPPGPTSGPLATVTLGRGCLDTIPAAHASGAFLLAWDGFDFVVDDQQSPGAAISVKLLTVTTRGALALGNAATDALTFAGRAVRPYPPGAFKIDGSYLGGDWDGSAVLTWAHRNRRVQIVAPVADYGAGNIGPEAGVTYQLRVVAVDPGGADLGVVYDVAGLTGTTATIVTANLGAVPRAADRLRFEAIANRGGFASWQRPAISMLLHRPTALTPPVIFVEG